MEGGLAPDFGTWYKEMLETAIVKPGYDEMIAGLGVWTA
jgi:hypothetical protein